MRSTPLSLQHPAQSWYMEGAQVNICPYWTVSQSEEEFEADRAGQGVESVNSKKVPVSHYGESR